MQPSANRTVQSKVQRHSQTFRWMLLLLLPRAVHRHSGVRMVQLRAISVRALPARRSHSERTHRQGTAVGAAFPLQG